jgi:hypothetical protein
MVQQPCFHRVALIIFKSVYGNKKTVQRYVNQEITIWETKEYYHVKEVLFRMKSTFKVIKT